MAKKPSASRSSCAASTMRARVRRARSARRSVLYTLLPGAPDSIRFPFHWSVVPIEGILAMTALSHALAVFDAIDSGDFSCLGRAVTADFVDHGSPIPL